jgi:hypothetical protein
MRDDDILGALADVLLGSGSLARTEVEEKWTVCIVDERGKVKRVSCQELVTGTGDYPRMEPRRLASLG